MISKWLKNFTVMNIDMSTKGRTQIAACYEIRQPSTLIWDSFYFCMEILSPLIEGEYYFFVPISEVHSISLLLFTWKLMIKRKQKWGRGEEGSCPQGRDHFDNILVSHL